MSHHDASGGDGAYVFADFPELDAVITQWKDLQTELQDDLTTLNQALSHMNAPAPDDASKTQAQATRNSLTKAVEHVRVMQNAAQQYVIDLKSARETMAMTEDANNRRFQQGNR